MKQTITTYGSSQLVGAQNQFPKDLPTHLTTHPIQALLTIAPRSE
jgi:hypothetical protein